MKIHHCLSKVKPSQVYLHDFRLYHPGEVTKISQELRRTAQTDCVLVIIDNAHDGPELDELCQELRAYTHITIQAAARTPTKCPQYLTEHRLGESFRLPKPGQRAMDEARPRQDENLAHTRKTRSKTDSDHHIRKICHGRSEFREPKDCPDCGEKAAGVLTDWGVGCPGSRYKYSDVMVLVRGDTELSHQRNNKDTQQSLGFVAGLCKAQIPVRIVGREDTEGLRELATMTDPENRVTVTHEHLVQGLERPVVVWVGVGTGDYYDVIDKWNATACTTDKVLWVQGPGDVDEDNETDDGDDV